MSKRKKVATLELKKPVFTIYQFPKYAGIRGAKTYETTHFVSPIFGTKVKDVVVVPFQVKTLGDTTKRFDAFRTKAKLSDKQAEEKYGTKYYEFSTIVTDRTREEYFGKPSFETSPQIEKKEEPVKTSIKPISRNFKERDIKKEEDAKDVDQDEIKNDKLIENDDVPLEKMIKLKYLTLGDNQIVDISPLKKMIKLEYLELENNQIVGINALKKLRQLKHI